MNKEFVPYELAVKLKELGFDEPCFTYYFEPTREIRTGLSIHINNGWTYSGTKRLETILAPLYQQAFRWFREKYHLIGGIEYIGGQKPETTWWDIYVVGHFNTNFSNMTMKYQPYEEAEIACLTKLIEIVQGGNNE